MNRGEGYPVLEKLHILSGKLLADVVKIPRETPVRLSTSPELSYSSSESIRRPRPFQRNRFPDLVQLTILHRNYGGCKSEFTEGR